MREQKIAYRGKKVFVGIDVHLKSYAVAAVSDGEVVEKATMPANSGEMLGWIGSRFVGAEVWSAYEAGFSGLSLHRALLAAGVKNIVVNAGSVETDARNRVKTDRRDALTLAVHLSQGRLRSIRILSEREEHRRELTRTREQLVLQRSRLITQIEMKLYYHGITAFQNHGKRLTSANCRRLAASIKILELKAALESLLSLWLQVDQQIRALAKLIRCQAEADPLQRIYNSIPGWGLLVSRVVANELGDMRQFANEKQLFSFSGLTPSEYSSGEHVRRGHISRQGSSRLRKHLVQAAWSAIRYDPAIKKQYLSLAARIGGKRAVVAIARRMLGWARALARTNQQYVAPIAEPIPSSV